MALRKAQGFHRKMYSTKTGLNRAAEDYGYTIERPEPFSVSGPIGVNISPYSPFAYDALDMSIEQVSKPIVSRGVYYVFRVLERSAVDEELFAQRAPAINEQIHQEKVQTYVTYWYTQLRENADIEDLRRGF